MAAVDSSAQALREREARSLKFFLLIVLLGYVCEGVILAVQVTVLPAEEVRVDGLVVFMVGGMAMIGLLYYALHRSLWLDRVGLVIAILNSTFAATAAYTLWRGFGAGAPIAELAVSWPFAAAGMASIAGMALTLRPLYVAIAGAGAVITLAGIHLVAAFDPATVYVMARADLGPGRVISIPRVLAELIFLGGATAMVIYAAHLARRTVREAVTLQRVTNQLSRYFSPDVAKVIRDDALEGAQAREQDIIVLFSDIAGFTRMCAGLSATQALAMLSEYQERMVAAIFQAGGTLDKFIGDGIMATFGTPRPQDDAADRALAAARGMNAALAALNEERAKRGEAPLAHRIGIHAGRAVVGNIGTTERREFGVIGDTVNVAARIEQACKKTGRTAMLSAAVRSRLKSPADLEPVGPVMLDGQPAPIELYALR